MGYRLAELARAVGAELRGDPELEIDGLASLEAAGPRQLSFVDGPAFRERAAASRAGALLVPSGWQGSDRPLLVVGNTPLARARLIALLHPVEPPAPGRHPTAVVGKGCAIDPSSYLGPYVVLGEGCRVGPRAVLHAHVVLGRGCRVAAGAVLHPHVVLYDRTEVGERAILHAGVILGADGFGYAADGGRQVKIPQVGRTVIEAEVEIGANSAVDRAVLEETRIGAGTKIDNLVQVGHNVRIGRGCVLCGQVGVAGSARLGDQVVMGGQSGVAGHLELGRGVRVAGKSAVFQSVPDGAQVGGVPAVELAAWRRQTAAAARLPGLGRRLRQLEERLAALEGAAERRSAGPRDEEEKAP